MTDTDDVNDALAAMAQAQRVTEAQFQHLMHTVVPDPDELRKMLLMNMTTRPKRRQLLLALTWMQSDPNEWDGWHPEVCENVARYFGIGEEA